MHLLEASTLKEAFSFEARQSLAGSAMKLMSGSCQLIVKPVNHPLLSCFSLSAGFSAPKGEDRKALVFAVALMSMVPAALPLDSLQVSTSQHSLSRTKNPCGEIHMSVPESVFSSFEFYEQVAVDAYC